MYIFDISTVMAEIFSHMTILTPYLFLEHKGLQVQNMQGKWVDCPPIDGTLVVAIGQGMEALTQGVCMSTTHRVLSPAPGTGARISIPFFQGVSLDAEFDEVNDLDGGGGVGRVPEDIKEMRRLVVARNGGRLDDVEFTFQGGHGARTLGEATLKNRIKSHPDVGGKSNSQIPISILLRYSRYSIALFLEEVG